MKPTVGPLAVQTPPSEVKYAKLGKKGESGGEKEEKEEGLQVEDKEREGDDSSGSEKASPPADKGGPSSSGLIDLPVSKTPGIAGKYVEMLDKEYGLVLNMKTNELSLRIGGDLVKIPKLSEWMEERSDGEKMRPRGKAR